MTLEKPIATTWQPPRLSWEADPRPLGDILKAWGEAKGLTRAQQAAALGVPITTLHGWHAGRPAAMDATVRRLMDRL